MSKDDFRTRNYEFDSFIRTHASRNETLTCMHAGCKLNITSSKFYSMLLMVKWYTELEGRLSNPILGSRCNTPLSRQNSMSMEDFTVVESSQHLPRVNG